MTGGLWSVPQLVERGQEEVVMYSLLRNFYGGSKTRVLLSTTFDDVGTVTFRKVKTVENGVSLQVKENVFYFEETPPKHSPFLLVTYLTTPPTVTDKTRTLTLNPNLEFMSYTELLVSGLKVMFYISLKQNLVKIIKIFKNNINYLTLAIKKL